MWAGARTILISAGGAYLIAARIHSPYMPWIGFVFLMGHMSVNHIYRQIQNNPSVVDITGTYDSQYISTLGPLTFVSRSTNGYAHEGKLAKPYFIPLIAY
jgi:hypothetical protein